MKLDVTKIKSGMEEGLRSLRKNPNLKYIPPIFLVSSACFYTLDDLQSFAYIINKSLPLWNSLYGEVVELVQNYAINSYPHNLPQAFDRYDFLMSLFHGAQATGSLYFLMPQSQNKKP